MEVEPGDIWDLTELEDGSLESISGFLKKKFDEKIIYAMAGAVLLSFNPFAEMNIYGRDFMNKYINDTIANLPPHIYGFLTTQVRRLKCDDSLSGMCIVLSGESGAGKTYTSEFISNYFSSVSSAASKSRLIDHMIPESNKIVEFFGNAQTDRSVNSSRFAKLTHIYLDSSMRLVGSLQRTFMLEKSRVVSRSCTERNYHCFYALMEGLSSEEKKTYLLENPSFYNYTRIGAKSPLHDLIKDNDIYNSLNVSMSMFDPSSELLHQSIMVISGILWTGNLEFEEDADSSVYIKNKDVLENIAQLFCVDATFLEQILCSYKIVVKSGLEVTTVPYSREKAIAFRDTLAKTLYEELFNTIMRFINKNLKSNSCYKYDISILDAFGFEMLKTNSLEQLCINHANERLHYCFVRNMIANEIEVYKEDGLGDILIDYPDSAVYLELMQSKINGIFSIIDEQTRFPNSTDLSLLESMVKRHGNNPLFKYVPTKLSMFTIKHYAMDIQYEIDNFIDKSTMTVQTGIRELVKESRLTLMDDFFPEVVSLEGNASSQRARSIGYLFCKQLDELVAKLESSHTAYIKCIKPNPACLPFLWDEEMIQMQLLCNGIPQALEVGKKVLPMKMSYGSFVSTFYYLLDLEDRAMSFKNPLEAAKRIINRQNITEGICYGKKRIFYKFDVNEKLTRAKKEIIEKSVLVLQSRYRVYRLRKRFLRITRAAIIIQSFLRGMHARKEILLMHTSARKIQSVWRGYVVRKLYKKLLIERVELKRAQLKQNLEKEVALATAQEKERSKESSDLEEKDVPLPDIKSTLSTKKLYTAPPISPPASTQEPFKDPTAAKYDEIMKVSNDLLDTISSAMTISSRSDTSKYNSQKVNTMTMFLGPGKHAVKEVLSVNISGIDIHHPSNQFASYAKNYFHKDLFGSTNTGLKSVLMKLKNGKPGSSISSALHCTFTCITTPMHEVLVESASLSDLAVGCFKNLLKYTTKKSCDLEHLSYIVSKGIAYPELRDEIYTQHILETSHVDYIETLKKLPHSLSRFWTSFYAVCSSFPPSKKLFKVVVTHLSLCKKTSDELRLKVRKIIQLCLLTLRKVYAVGARTKFLSLNELHAIKETNQVVLSVYFMDGSVINCKVYSHTRVDEVLSFVVAAVGQRNLIRWGLTLRIGSIDVVLNSSDYLYDAIYSAYDCIKHDNDTVKIDHNSIDINSLKLVCRRVTFNKDIPELLNPCLYKSLYLQIEESMWIAAPLIPANSLIEMATLSLAIKSIDAQAHMSPENFQKSLTLALEKKMEVNIDSEEAAKRYKSYVGLYLKGGDNALKMFFNAALAAKSIIISSFDGVYGTTDTKCIITMLHTGVIVIDEATNKCIASVPVALMTHHEECDELILILSISKDTYSGTQTYCPMEVLILKTKYTTEVGKILSEICPLPGSEDLKLKEKPFGFDTNALELSLNKSKKVLIDNKVVRGVVEGERATYNMIFESSHSKSSSSKEDSMVNLLTKKSHLKFTDTSRDVLSKGLNQTELSKMRSIRGKVSDYLHEEPPSMDSIIWDYFPRKLLAPLTKSRVPTTWAAEMWTFLEDMSRSKKWSVSCLGDFFKLVFNAPQPFVDELYMILSNMTSGSFVNRKENAGSLQRLWSFFYTTCLYFPCSPLITDYIRAHIRYIYGYYLDRRKDGWALQILRVVNGCRKVFGTRLSKPRVYPPTECELGYVLALAPVHISVSMFSQNITRVVKVRPVTTFDKMKNSIMKTCNLFSSDSIEYCTYSINNNKYWTINKNSDYVCDVIAFDAKRLSQMDTNDSNKSQVKFILRVLTCSVAIDELAGIAERYYYIVQVVNDICSGILPLPTIFNMTDIAANLIQYCHGDFRLDNSSVDYEDALLNYIPEALRANQQITADSIRNKHMALVTVTKSQALHEITQNLSKWPLHNAVIFDVEQNYNPLIGQMCKMSVSCHCIMFNPTPNGDNCQGMISISDICGVVECSGGIVIAYNTDSGLSRFMLKTPRYLELSCMIKTYSKVDGEA